MASGVKSVFTFETSDGGVTSHGIKIYHGADAFEVWAAEPVNAGKTKDDYYASLKGQPGPVGPKGDKGDKGDAGPAGPAGGLIALESGTDLNTVVTPGMYLLPGGINSPPNTPIKMLSSSSVIIAVSVVFNSSDVGHKDATQLFIGTASTGSALMYVRNQTKGAWGAWVAAHNYALPAAKADALGGVKQGVAVADSAGDTPTKGEFSALLASLRAAGVIAAS